MVLDESAGATPAALSGAEVSAARMKGMMSDLTASIN